MLAMLRMWVAGAQLLALRLESIQLREDHWVIANLVGKAQHVRTVPTRSMYGRSLRVSRTVSCSARSTKPDACGVTGCLPRCSGCRPSSCGPSQHRQAGTARSSAHMRETLSLGRRRTRSDSVPSGARFDSDHGTLPRMQTEAAVRRQRSARDRARFCGVSRFSRGGSDERSALGDKAGPIHLGAIRAAPGRCYADRSNPPSSEDVKLNKCPTTNNLADISCEAVLALCCEPCEVSRDMPVGILLDRSELTTFAEDCHAQHD